MKLILSFLGTGKYEQADYPLDGQIYSTPYTQEAIRCHYPDYALKVLLTEKAAVTHGQALRERVEYESVPIPAGRSEAELWDIFNAIVEAVPEGAELVMDVSHGFRSQPILALAVLQLLQVVKRVRVKRVLYGAFDTETKQADFFDLTPFLELMEWTQATRDLLEYGNGGRLRQLLKQIHRHSYMVDGPRAKELSSVGEILEGVGSSLELLRINEVLEQAKGLLRALATARDDVTKLPRSRPLGLLLGRIEERYQTLATDNLFDTEGLKAQAAMIELLLETGSYAQAIALARELMVTWLCLQRQFDPISERSAAENLLGSHADAVRKKQAIDEHKAKLGLLWDKISYIRNDIAHAAMRPRPLPSQSLAQQVRDACSEVQKLIQSA
jgi:CRISPR-associated DxTHG motif protein